LNLKKIAVYQLDIEKERFPLANESVDIIIANQILEHVKEIYWIFHEITRLLRLGGSLIIGVPNLAAFHNRILLFMGRQPTPAHIRGYTHHGFLKFLNSCWEGGYVEKDFKGSNFYPFPPLIAKPLASIWPNFAWGIFMLFTKVQSYDDAFLRFPIEQRLETNFYLGNERFFLNNLPVEHSFLQNMPWARAKRRLYLPLMPLAIESFDLSSADLLISSSMAVAKGILTHSEQLHICYCHSPARYAWDLTHQYLHEADLERGFKAALARMVLHYIRLWDISAANRVDHFIANSKYISRRIWRVYRRESTVIYPPVDVDRFKSRYNKEEFYLTVSRVVPYKKVDLIVETFAQTKKKLIVVGEGPDLKQIKGKATSNIEFLGYQPNDIVEDILQGGLLRP